LKAKRTILFFLLLSALIPTPLVRADPGWLTGWTYRKSHTITGSTEEARTDYQIGIIIYYGDGVDGTEVIPPVTFGKVYMDSKCQGDFDDIRFTNSSGSDLLDYWNETISYENYGIFWVEVDSIPKSPSTVDIYIYYGNDEANTISNGDNTFPFFDDFLGTSLDTDKWQGDTGFASVSGSILTLIGVDPAGWKQLYCKADFYETPPMAIRQKTKFKGVTANKGSTIGARHQTTQDMVQVLYFSASNKIRVISAGTTTTRDSNADAVENIYDILWVSSTLADFYKAGAQMTNSPLVTNVPTVSIPIMFESTGGISYGIECDWVLWREYVDPEPTHTAWGEEQESPTPYLPTNLFGAGFNDSSPYASLYWKSNLTNVDFFEIQNSTDKISWDHLGTNTTTEYHDFEVVNGTERYYRVRACHFEHDQWFNSSFTDINFEKVYFFMPIGNGLVPSLFPGLAFGIALFIIAAAYYYYQRR